MRQLFFCVILLTGAILLHACKKDQPKPDPTCSTSFSATVSVIVQTNCAYSGGCHGSGSTNAGGPFTSYALIAAKKDIIKGQVEAGIMPQGASLTAGDKAALIAWINCGAPNN
ncbi:MAG: hypothetical protein K2Q24_02000 [Chitinophagaceae bacterium]|jgi:hypothetical protein|nr:hypothetical protein [Chitinophagaceae bacterium]